jgi:hypothetical protein
MQNKDGCSWTAAEKVMTKAITGKVIDLQSQGR